MPGVALTVFTVKTLLTHPAVMDSPSSSTPDESVRHLHAPQW